MSKVFSLLVVLSLFLCVVNQVHGWGADGHKMIAYIAQSFVSQKTLTSLKAQLGSNNLWDIVNWPDDYGHTTNGKWSSGMHYVDLQVNSTWFTLLPACESYCVVTAIWNYTGILVDSNDKKIVQNCSTYVSGGAEPCALSFLSHFAGDIHQPLHVSYAVDFGGNDFTVTYFGSDTNLHSVWDTKMIVTWENGKTWEDKAIEITNDLKQNPYLLAEYQNVTNVQKWANESFFHTRFTCYNIEPGSVSVYRNYDNSNTGASSASVSVQSSTTHAAGMTHDEEEHRCGREMNSPRATATTCMADLGTVYYERNIPIIEQRLGMAGARLAYLLNSIYDPSSNQLIFNKNWRSLLNHQD